MNTDAAMMECPSWGRCSAPKCPLDLDKQRRVVYPDEDRCRAGKATISKIAKKYNINLEGIYIGKL